MASQMITVIGNELKAGFFVTLCESMGLDCETVCAEWDKYFGTPTFLPSPSTTPVKHVQPPKAKVALKHTKGGVERSQQTMVDVNNLDKLKVADLKQLNKERGISCSGNRALLVELLVEYEKAVGNDDAQPSSNTREQSKPKSTKINVASGKTAKKGVVTTVPPALFDIETDEYGNSIILGKLVIRSPIEEVVEVVGFVHEDTRDIMPLDRTHIEMCKEHNIKYISSSIEDDE
jgi:hypothetical protein